MFTQLLPSQQYYKCKVHCHYTVFHSFVCLSLHQMSNQLSHAFVCNAVTFSMRCRQIDTQVTMRWLLEYECYISNQMRFTKFVEKYHRTFTANPFFSFFSFSFTIKTTKNHLLCLQTVVMSTAGQTPQTISVERMEYHCENVQNLKWFYSCLTCQIIYSYFSEITRTHSSVTYPLKEGDASKKKKMRDKWNKTIVRFQ